MRVIDIVARKTGWEIIAPNLIMLIFGLLAFAAIVFLMFLLAERTSVKTQEWIKYLVFLVPALLPQSQSDFQHLVVRDILHVILTDGAARGHHVPHEYLVQLASLLMRLRAFLEDAIEAIFSKLTGEGRELLVEVAANCNLGVSVLLDHVPHNLQDSRRLISHPLSHLWF
jgi:hypothetical protein